MPQPTGFVWIKDKVTGHTYAVHESAVDPERHEDTGKSAYDENGDLRPAKPNLRASNRRSATSQTPSAASEPTTKEKS